MQKILYLTIICFLYSSLIAPLALAAPTLTIEEISDLPDPFSPNGDGLDDEAIISAEISASGFSPRRALFLVWRVSISDSQGQPIRRLTQRKVIRGASEISVSQSWNGKNYLRRVVPDGTYSYSIDARIGRVKAAPKSGVVTVTTPVGLSVTLSPDFWEIGTVEITSVTTMNEVDRITVTNDGQSNTTYSLCLVDPQGWSVSQTTVGPEQYILNAAFSEQAGAISWEEASHALSTTPVRATATNFAGDQTGVNVMPNEERTLWLQFKAPSATSIATEQAIEVIISAQIP